jgi:hypothetical protein
MTAYKCIDKESSGRMYDRLIYKYGNETIVLANFTDSQFFIGNYVLDRMIEKGKVEPVDLLEQQWIHPHLFLPLKKDVEKERNKNFYNK